MLDYILPPTVDSNYKDENVVSEEVTLYPLRSYDLSSNRPRVINHDDIRRRIHVTFRKRCVDLFWSYKRYKKLYQLQLHVNTVQHYKSTNLELVASMNDQLLQSTIAKMTSSPNF